MGKLINLTGKVFGRLTVIERANEIRRGDIRWLCNCSCGNTVIVFGDNLKRGHSQSCGCFRKEAVRERMTSHGHCGEHKTPTYISWLCMISRCTNPNHEHFHYYAGRGITVCDRWLHSFENFLADMGPRPPKLTLERKKNDLGYFPENCEWRDGIQQANNKRNNHVLEFNGRTQTMTQWAHEVGFPMNTIWNRIKVGWSVERALTEPLRHG